VIEIGVMSVKFIMAQTFMEKLHYIRCYLTIYFFGKETSRKYSRFRHSRSPLFHREMVYGREYEEENCRSGIITGAHRMECPTCLLGVSHMSKALGFCRRLGLHRAKNLLSVPNNNVTHALEGDKGQK